ncbi:MAG: MBL fold metallo-hydrolase [Chloroflexi bacterium]|nr:MBL fold metallo-hydrolase [Chloroflexota bacterium]MBT5628403.1 MBL fold metallo-hydrolase [Chloroflexota bacterium]
MKLLRATIAFTFGIAAEQALSATPTALEIVVALVAVFGIVATAIYARRHFTLAILLLFAVVGLSRAVLVNDQAPHIAWGEVPRNEARVELEGLLLSEPTPSNGRTRLRLQVMAPDSSAAGYSIDVYTERLHDLTDSSRRSNDFRYGDAYRVSGRFVLTTGRQDIAGLISTSSVELVGSTNGSAVRSRIAELRSDISYSITDALDSSTGGLAAALLVGDRTKLSEETIDNFRASGLSHVLAISGLHIAMIGGIIMAISVWILGRQRQLYLLAPGLGVWVYAVLAGLTPSVTRAAIMFSVYLLARLLGRQRSVLPPLALAGAIMLAINPPILQSISFQLSFAAVLGIALLSARIAGRASDSIQTSTRLPTFIKRPITGIVYGMSVSLAATIATAPLVAFHFGQIPIWGIPSTLLIVPVLPLFIAGSLLVAIVGAVAEQTIPVAGILSHGIGNYISFVANLFAGLPIGPVNAVGWSIPLIFGWYAAVLIAINRRAFSDSTSSMGEIIRSFRVAGRSAGTSSGQTHALDSRRYTYSVVAIWAVAAISLAGFVVSSPTSSELTVTFFETNRGDMILVETPSGVRMLVDGGDDPDLTVRNIESVLPPLDRRIDLVLSTHPDADHLGGLQHVVERFEVQTIIDSGVPHNSNIYESWAQLIRTEPDVVVTDVGMVIALDAEVVLSILQTQCVVVECSNFNDEGVVARLEYGEISLLLTGDVTSGGEFDLIQTGQLIKSTVLKVGHHGSRTSTTQAFLDAVDPALAIVTTGIKNQFGHPHEDVIERLNEQLSPENVYVTRDNGTLTVTTDGERVWVSAER